jgi:hypothetical protein
LKRGEDIRSQRSCGFRLEERRVLFSAVRFFSALAGARASLAAKPTVARLTALGESLLTFNCGSLSESAGKQWLGIYGAGERRSGSLRSPFWRH